MSYQPNPDNFNGFSKITEHELGAFRGTQLSPQSAISKIPAIDSILLFDEPPGIGKTTLGQGLIDAALNDKYDLVIFVAPTRAIIQELENSHLIKLGSQHIVIFKPRPKQQCGDLNVQWQEMETTGCSALAKDQLCGSCPFNKTCFWPNQMELVNNDTKLIVLTEAYLKLNPSMVPSLISKTKSETPLVILDEALFLTENLSHSVDLKDLETFADTLSTATISHPLGEINAKRWLKDVKLLLAKNVEIDQQPRLFAGSIEHATLELQTHGRNCYGRSYRHLTHELSLLNSPVTSGQWREKGSLEISVRIDLGSARAIVLAPNMPAKIVEERLNRTVELANPNHIFCHSKTNVINIVDGIGTTRSMNNDKHRKRMVDTFATLAIRNIFHGRRTVLICKKCFRHKIAGEIKTFAKSAEIHLDVIPIERAEQLTGLSAHQIPIINYGIVGINALKDYDAIYCIGSYYIQDEHLVDLYNCDLRPERRNQFRIRTEDNYRSVLAANENYSTRYHAERASEFHQALERRTVLQAVGRARPFTTPTEVILFQQNNFDDCFENIDTYDTLGAFRKAKNLPTETEIKRAVRGGKMRSKHRNGASYREIAKQFDCSTSTVHKAMNMVPFLDVISGGANIV